MTWRYLVDTNILSQPTRHRPLEAVLSRLEADAERIVTAAPVWHELRYGLARLPGGRRREIIARYLAEVVSTVPIIPYGREAAAWHAGERARLTAAGQTPPFVDGQIAAIAVVNALTLVTCNVRDFEQFLELEIEDWSTR